MVKFLSSLIACILLSPFAASAATGLRVQPVKISETMQPGQTITGVATISNASDGPVDVITDVQDFIPVAGAEGIQFVGRAEGLTTVRDWITLHTPKTFRLEHNETKEVSYTIAAPANAEPGGHFGVLFFKAVEAGETGLKVGTQVGVLTLVTIPGNRLQKGVIHSFTATPFVQTGPVNFAMNFENTGTVHFEPKGQITIYDMFGREAGIAPIEGQVVLPTSIKKLSMSWPGASVLVGRYTARATVVDGEGETLTTGTVTFWAFPVWYSLAFLVSFIVFFLIFKFLRKRVKISIVK